ncbi:MAG: hypothetical protein K2R93_07690 [Gemmatimonadaceae bacterium]|nr:hypothetical protein [Gemmatimonadaceae bacterium]
MTSRFDHFPRRVCVAALLLAAWHGLAQSAAAQTVTGVGDDAIPLPKRGWRFGIGGLWNDYTSVYTPNGSGGLTRQPLYGGFNTSAAGVAQFPTLSAAETALRTLTGDSKFQLSLGALETRAAVRQSIAPLSVDYGVTKRLSLRLVVPYVESRDATQFLLNRTGAATDIGINPAATATGSGARGTNGALLAQIDAARSTLSGELARCAVAAATGCDVIRANAMGAQTLLSRSLTVRSALAALYGTGTAAGAPVVPVSGSSVQTAVSATIAALRSDFVALGITNLTSSAAPVPATTIMGPGGGFSRIASDSAFRVGYATRGNTRRAGIGDIDLTATYLLFDSFRADQVTRLFENRRAVRSTITAGWRFGVAGADRTDDAFDVPIGEGANALLVRSTTDLVWSRRLWLSATLRAAKPLSDAVAVILPFRDVAGLFAPVQVGQATRALGMRYDLELAPRVAIGQFFGLSGALLLRHWGEDSYRALGADSLAGGVTTDLTPSRTLRAVSIGATFSTLASYTRGRSRFPAEVIYTHTEPLGASGGAVPAVATERLELRVYRGFPRR